MCRVHVNAGSVALALCLLAFDAARAAEPVAIEAILAQAVAFKFDSVPLDKVLQELTTRFHIPLVIDHRAIEAGGIPLQEMKVTCRAKDVSLETALHDLLAPHQLGVLSRHDIAWITPIVIAESYYDTRVYKVTRRVPVERRMRSIMWSVEAGSWTTSGGRGDIAPVPPNMLLIYQSPRRHRQIVKAFADSIVLMRADKPNPARQSTELERQLELPAMTDFEAVPFGDAIEQLAKQQAVEISIDEATIGFSGRAIDEAAVTLHVGEVRSLASALSVILDVVSLDLEWIVEDDAITITTAEAAAEVMIPVNYDVQNIVADGDATPLIEALQYTVAASSWETKGGNGTIKAHDNGTTLEVVQSYPVHRTLRQILAKLRMGVISGSKVDE